MANGVEIRMPFLDYRLITLAFSLPWTAKIRGGYSKAIVRDAMAPYMPSEIAYRKMKVGFNSPVVDWMRGPLKPFMLDTISSRSFRESALVDAPRVATAVRSVVEGSKPTFAEAQGAWTDLAPYLWEQAVLRRDRPSGKAFERASEGLAGV
jgi:asparagine synthase (glutamine-hydrolysing)